MKIEFRLLGPLEVLRDGEPVALRAAKVRALLGTLLVHRGRVASVDRLVEDLWQESPPTGARHALEAQVSRLRGALGDAAPVAAQPPGYILEVDPEAIDSVRFESLLADARAAQAADPERASALAAEALALWRGPPLADFTYEPFAQAEIARLDALRWTAVELRLDAELALGHGGLVPELEALVAAEPVRERLRAQLMLALYREGRQADALAAYRDARTALVEELGIEPGPELRELEAAILRQDKALARPVRAPSAPQRKLATILFADLADSSGLAVALDPEALRALLHRYFDAASAAVARHGGVVEKFVGDAVMAVFGSPLAHEDDALRAARAAVELRDAVARLDEDADRDLGVRLRVRIGLATGEVLAGGGAGDPLATGPAVIVASRLQQEVEPGEIAVDELTRRLTAGAGRFAKLGDVDLRGLRQPMQAFRLEELSPDAPALARRLDAPLVGRVDELAALREALDAAVRDRVLQTVAVLGPPGIGKSRLTRELVDAVAADATVLRGRCDAYGEGTTFRPLREALGSPEDVAAALEGEPEAEAIASRLEAVFHTDTAVPAEEVPWAFRRYCETLAARGPVVLVLDDLHWAEPPLLDLVEYLATSSRDAPILLVCVAREELAEERPALPGRRDESRARAALRRRDARACRPAAARVRARRGHSRPPRRRRRGKPALPRAARRARGGDRAAGAAADAARAARGEARPARPRGARRARARRRRGPRLRARRRDGAARRVRRADGRSASRRARPPRLHPRRRRHRVPLPPLADPRRRIPRRAEAAAGGTARTVRRRARASPARTTS